VTNTDISDKIPYVGIGCVVVRDGKLLLVCNQRGFWSTPGGHLDFGESPDVCAARETFEETGISVTNVEFVAITNDVLTDVGKHYLTVWMRGDADDATAGSLTPPRSLELDGLPPIISLIHCTFTFSICFRVIVGPVHLRTCHSRFP
jgi:8-oxo-dGTP diphosphatase